MPNSTIYWIDRGEKTQSANSISNCTLYVTFARKIRFYLHI